MHEHGSNKPPTLTVISHQKCDFGSHVNECVSGRPNIDIATNRSKSALHYGNDEYRYLWKDKKTPKPAKITLLYLCYGYPNSKS
jgi:hypothetical protein